MNGKKFLKDALGIGTPDVEETRKICLSNVKKKATIKVGILRTIPVFATLLIIVYATAFLPDIMNSDNKITPVYESTDANKNNETQLTHVDNSDSESRNTNSNNTESQIDSSDNTLSKDHNEIGNFIEPSSITPMYQLIKDNTLSPGEFAGDMYRPAGYDENIGSALALKMQNHNNEEDYLYNVVVWTVELRGVYLQEAIAKAENSFGYSLCFEKWIKVGTGVKDRLSSSYYYLFTANEIKTLAESKVICMYVGSGESKVSVNWDTAEGIEAFCELTGDMYVANGTAHYSEGDMIESSVS